MTESIKQEIINNIFENGDKLITGPILQTVLIDMIDDVNVKDQAILSKTGSWDEAVTQIPNLATKAEVTNLSESVARDLENVVDVDLTGYATEQWVQNQGYLKEHQDLSDYATKVYVNEAKSTLESNLNNLSSSVSNDIQNKGEEVKTWVQNQGYLKEHQDISGLATKTELNSVSQSVQTDISNLATKGELNSVSESIQTNITSLSESVARDLANVDVDLTGYATETWVQSQGYLKEHQDISNLATKTELNSVSESIQTDITNLSESVANSAVWKKSEGQDSIAQIITTGNAFIQPNASGTGSIATGYYTTASGSYSHAEGSNTEASGDQSHAEGRGTIASGNSSHAEGTGTKALGNFGSHAEGRDTEASGWGSHAEGQNTVASDQYSHAEGKGTKASGMYSHAEGGSTVASGFASHAEGSNTTASGMYSHAEGYGTNASAGYSHAEGYGTTASGYYSHAEGFHTIASNDYEHAQGTYNHKSTNQIFSVGVGNSIKDPDTQVVTETRRNAISVLAVQNNDSYTASFFVQNIGGYDGTNPTPGTNDLATVINGMSSGGGSSETLWKKGEGESSIVQITSDADYLKPSATGKRAIATGKSTRAEGESSHAEGYNAKALGLASHTEGYLTEASGVGSHAEGRYTTATGNYSHAEGDHTVASGQASHTEGLYTSASNDYEHAQGRYNHTSSNQIFSIGTGNSETDRRNAVSVLEVDNSGSYTSSFFVQNIGGYDGTNPLPGTNDLATVINNLPSGGSSETLWKKGTGTDSIVQKVTNISLTEPIASGVGAAAIGDKTKASGWSSHAEGGWTEAQGNRSHAEGSHTRATGEGSHAEGYFAVASNNYEHAQGLWNHTSSNQIFSIGAGDGDPSNPESATRRNAISVLAVDNSGSYTSSFFVQNIGGYDGTNPEPGTNDLATVINNLPSGGGSSETLWKKGTGTDSIAQILSGDREANTPTATGTGSIATGEGTKASGNCSHAEGSYSKASGPYSHAEGEHTTTSGYCSHTEGMNTTTSGMYSHAEGRNTKTSNAYEHAQGRYNHNSENQIFSIGTGNSDSDRRNAVSVLEVDNSGSYTSSFFVQNVGGYDGTNPTPGTNDLATVLNNTETWTFTLEDGSTVTKTIVMR